MIMMTSQLKMPLHTTGLMTFVISMQSGETPPQAERAAKIHSGDYPSSGREKRVRWAGDAEPESPVLQWDKAMLGTHPSPLEGDRSFMLSQTQSSANSSFDCPLPPHLNISRPYHLQDAIGIANQLQLNSAPDFDTPEKLPTFASVHYPPFAAPLHEPAVSNGNVSTRLDWVSLDLLNSHIAWEPLPKGWQLSRVGCTGPVFFIEFESFSSLLVRFAL